jgi:hypothetical protein
MRNISIQTRPLEISQQILEHAPDTTMKDIADIISEWGDLISDRRHSVNKTSEVDTAEHGGQSQDISKT